jgi:hypothetical protein
MPVRGLKNTLPLHWDGTLGDPFGGPNGAGGSGTNCGPDDQSCFRQLANASLSGVMCAQQGGCANGPSGDPGLLTGTERDQMATFLQSVSYPPPRSRRVDDSLTGTAQQGFSDFFLNQGGIGGAGGISTCADLDAGCHALPLGASTCDGSGACVVGAFDAPTMRGLTDRFLQFSLGTTNGEEILISSLAALPGVGCNAKSWNPTTDAHDEALVFASAFPGVFQPVYGVCPDDIFQMAEEASTGYSGAIGRQVTLNTVTTAACTPCEVDTILAELEAADANGVVNLQGKGRRNANSNFNVEYNAGAGNYRNQGGATFSRSQLISEAQSGAMLLTLTAELRANVGDLLQFPQPVLAPAGGTLHDSIEQAIPAGTAWNVVVQGIDVSSTAKILIDGQLVSGSVSCTASGGVCISNVTIPIPSPGLSSGLHQVQVQNPKGLLSNELPICAGAVGGCL